MTSNKDPSADPTKPEYEGNTTANVTFGARHNNTVSDARSLSDMTEHLAEIKASHPRDKKVEDMTNSFATKWTPHRTSYPKESDSRWSWQASLFPQGK